MHIGTTGTSTPGVYPPRHVAWWGCVVLTFGSILGFADRGIVNLFVVPIQRDLQLNDTQISLILGLAFGLFNALLGLPLGRWVDSGNRTRIAALGVAVWSVATAACGLATNFWQLFLARAGVGGGEATIAPAGVSLLADLFPPNRRGLPLGIFYGSLFLGSGGALLVGGLLWRILGDRLIVLPIVGALHSWQVILLIVAAAGLLIAPLTLTIREPVRRNAAGGAEAAGTPLSEVLRFYRTHARTLGGHHLAFLCFNFTLYAGSAWLPTLLVRNYGWDLTQAGTTMGGMMLILGPAGSATAGLLADWLGRRGRSDSKFVVCIGAALAMVILTGALTTSLPPPGILAVLAGFAFFGTFSLPMAAGTLQDLMPNAMRGQAIAIFLALVNVVAGSLAATTVAVLTDYLFRDPAKINLAFGLVGLFASLLAGGVLVLTRASYRRTVLELAFTPGADAARTAVQKPD